jgi:hypothetical protein
MKPNLTFNAKERRNKTTTSVWTWTGRRGTAAEDFLLKIGGVWCTSWFLDSHTFLKYVNF